MAVKGWFVKYKSKFTGEDCVCTITKSENAKTGRHTLQIAYMAAKGEPHKRLKTGRTKAICGKCPFQNDGCYVVVCQAPLSIYRAWKRGTYKPLRRWQGKVPARWKGKHVRFGMYGDPASAPAWVYDLICRELEPTRTELYTHAWNERRFKWLRLCGMASVSDPLSAVIAYLKEWRTFRIRCGGDLLPWESKCANEAAGILCENCGRCGPGGGPKYPVITAHGYTANRAAKHIVDYIAKE